MLLHDSPNMEQSVPENLSTHVFSECKLKLLSDPVDSENVSTSEKNSDPPTKDSPANHSPNQNPSPSSTNSSTTKVKLSFSVDRLLGEERNDDDPRTSLAPPSQSSRQCCDGGGGIYSCCSYPSCFPQTSEAAKQPAVSAPQAYTYPGLNKFYPGIYMDYKSILRPTPIRAAEHVTFPTMATNALLRFHQQQQQHQHQQQQQQQQQQQLLQHHGSATAAAALLAPLNSLKTLQLTQQQRFLAKTAQQQFLDIPATATAAAASNNGSSSSSHNGSSNSVANNNSSSSSGGGGPGNNGKRKRSWSRAVFTNLQRKGLEIQFQQQKYITKPDRRKLAARLNLTDAQVKVWFQNRRMKWRHTRENLKSGHEKQPQQQPSHLGSSSGSVSGTAKPLLLPTAGLVATPSHEPLDYSSDSCSSVELSEKADDEDDNIEIDVVE